MTLPKVPFNPPRFVRKGIRIHDPGNQSIPDQMALKQGLPVNPGNVAKALTADIQEPSEGPDVRNQLKRFGGNPNP